MFLTIRAVMHACLPNAVTGYKGIRRSRRALPTTESELHVMAILAQIGEIKMPSQGYRIPAAAGTLKTL
jgi:hypothetical protein